MEENKHFLPPEEEPEDDIKDWIPGKHHPIERAKELLPPHPHLPAAWRTGNNGKPSRMKEWGLTIGNVTAGLSVGAYLIPQAMAYGTLSGVGAAAGLAAAVVPLILYTVFGRHKWLSVGPESAVALMAGASAATVAAEMNQPVVGILALMALLVGLILLAARLLKAAFLADLLSTPVLLGYLAGVGILMILSQLPKITGLKLSTDTLPEFLTHSQWGVPDWRTLLVGLLVTAICLVAPKINKWIPGTLVALIVSIFLGQIFKVPTIGKVATAFPAFMLPTLDLKVITAVLGVSLAVTAVAYADVIVAARAFNDGQRVNPNREIVSLAAAQIGAGFFSGYPMSASSSRTALARTSGATSKHYSYFVAIVLVLAPLLLGVWLSKIPVAGLAGVIIYAAITLINPKDWVMLKRNHRSELLIALLCAAIVVIAGILYGVSVAIFGSVFLFMARVSRPHSSELGFVPETAGMHSTERNDDATTLPGLVVFRYEAPLFFINASDFYTKTAEAVKNDTLVVLLNMEATPQLDATTVETIEQLVDYMHGQRIELWFARAQKPVVEQLEVNGILAKIAEKTDTEEKGVFPTLPTAVAAFKAHYYPNFDF